MPSARRLGSHEEDEAARYLAREGFTIVRRRAKMRSGEIDIVALDGETLVFVEVKSRAGGDAEAAIDRAKAHRLALAAAEYVVANEVSDRPSRFDLIAISPEGFRHYRDIFRP